MDGSADGNAAGSDLSSDFHHWIARILGYFGFFALFGQRVRILCGQLTSLDTLIHMQVASIFFTLKTSRIETEGSHKMYQDFFPACSSDAILRQMFSHSDVSDCIVVLKLIMYFLLL